MKRKFTALFSCILLIILLFPLTAAADIGPKPSIIINFENMGDELCYGTLLSEEDSTGAYYVWDGNDYTMPDPSYTDMDIWKAFVDYKDEDGYYFLQETFPCSTDKKIEWTYCPPDRFKILLYYPETETFISSGIYERFAFHSYFNVSMHNTKIVSVEQDEERSVKKRPSYYDDEYEENALPVLIAERAYSISRELLGLFCRIIITILLEFGVAFLFGFGRKHLLIWIGIVNIITQILLNLILNFSFHNSGSLFFAISYILLECFVFITEAASYLVIFPKTSCLTIPGRRIILYALTANIVSFGGGVLIARIIPIFF